MSDPREVLVRRVPPPDHTVRYGPDPDHVADLRLPADTPAGPLVVFLHGGFWRAEYDRRHVGPLALGLADAGYPVACVEYRRLGQRGGGVPGTFDDILAAVAHVPEAVADRTGDTAGPPIVAGHSAGGHLALWAGCQAQLEIAGVLALAPVADLALAYRLGIGDGAVADLLGGGPDDEPARYAYAQPRRPDCPATIVHGVADDIVPIEVARGYAARTGVPMVELSGVEHYAVIDPASAAWPAVLGALRVLAASTSP